MKKNQIKYIGFYDYFGDAEERKCSLAAVNKMNYLSEVLSEFYEEVYIISPSWSEKIKCKFKGKKKTLEKNIKLILCPTFSFDNKIGRMSKQIYSILWLFFWLIKNVEKNEQIIVYHSQMIAIAVLLAKKIKRFKVILEVEEVYHTVVSSPWILKQLEKLMINKAEKYIFANDLFKNNLSIDGKKSVVYYGIYKDINKAVEKMNNKKINLVYSGVIDSKKLGVFNAINAMEYLDCNYMLHILGFGDSESLKQMEKCIENINKKNMCRRIVFYGKKEGDDFIEFLKSCDIGLSTQSVEGVYNEFTFPSKILTYLSCDLKVVTCNIECVKKSKVAKNVNFYRGNSYRNIANTIRTVNLHGEGSTQIIKELEREFKEHLSSILE